MQYDIYICNIDYTDHYIWLRLHPWIMKIQNHKLNDTSAVHHPYGPIAFHFIDLACSCYFDL